MDQPTSPIPATDSTAKTARRRPRALGTLVTGLVLAAVSLALVVGVLSDAHGVTQQVGRLGATFHISEAGALASPVGASAIESRVDP